MVNQKETGPVFTKNNLSDPLPADGSRRSNKSPSSSKVPAHWKNDRVARDSSENELQPGIASDTRKAKRLIEGVTGDVVDSDRGDAHRSRNKITDSNKRQLTSGGEKAGSTLERELAARAVSIGRFFGNDS